MNASQRVNEIVNKYQKTKQNTNEAEQSIDTKVEADDERHAVSSSGLIPISQSADTFQNLGARIENLNGFDMLKFEIQPGASLVSNQDTMSYMDGGLTMRATLGTGFFSAVMRGLSGSSVLQNTIENTTSRPLSIVLSPLLQGSIVQVNIKAGESWKFADRSFLACTPNLTVTGNLNIFKNFSMVLVSQNISFVKIIAPISDGIVWISAHGACEAHSIVFGTGDPNPFFINNGCFLGMVSEKNGIDYYQDYVRVGLASSMFNSFFTDLGFVMKIQDTVPPKRTGHVPLTVLTQSLNPHNLEKYISAIVEQKMSHHHHGGAFQQMNVENTIESAKEPEKESVQSFLKSLRYRKTLRNR